MAISIYSSGTAAEFLTELDVFMLIVMLDGYDVIRPSCPYKA